MILFWFGTCILLSFENSVWHNWSFYIFATLFLVSVNPQISIEATSSACVNVIFSYCHDFFFLSKESTWNFDRRVSSMTNVKSPRVALDLQFVADHHFNVWFDDFTLVKQVIRCNIIYFYYLSKKKKNLLIFFISIKMIKILRKTFYSKLCVFPLT